MDTAKYADSSKREEDYFSSYWREHKPLDWCLSIDGDLGSGLLRDDYFARVTSDGLERRGEGVLRFRRDTCLAVASMY